jgi:hypothetical protein
MKTLLVPVQVLVVAGSITPPPLMSNRGCTLWQRGFPTRQKKSLGTLPSRPASTMSNQTHLSLSHGSLQCGSVKSIVKGIAQLV